MSLIFGDGVHSSIRKPYREAFTELLNENKIPNNTTLEIIGDILFNNDSDEYLYAIPYTTKEEAKIDIMTLI